MDKRSKLNVGLERRCCKARQLQAKLTAQRHKLFNLLQQGEAVHDQYWTVCKLANQARETAGQLFFKLPWKSYLRLSPYLRKCRRHKKKCDRRVNRINTGRAVWLPGHND